MKLKTKAEKIIKKIGGILNKVNFIESMFVTGSFSTNHFDKYSDIDITLTTNKKIKAKDIWPYIKEFVKKENIIYENESSSYRIDSYIGGVSVMLNFRQAKKVLSEFGDINKITQYEIEKQRRFMVFKKAKIIFDKKGRLKKIKNKIKIYPSQMRNFILHERIHKLNYYLFLDDGAINVEINRGNILEANHLILEVIHKIYEIIYALNNTFLTDRKWALDEIKYFKTKPKNISKRLTKISDLNNTKRNFKTKIHLLKELSKDLNNLIKKTGIKNLPALK